MELKPIKDKLNNREIVPSQKAWEKLEIRLDGIPAKNQGWKYYFAAAAACLLIGFMLFQVDFGDGSKNEIAKEGFTPVALPTELPTPRVQPQTKKSSTALPDRPSETATLERKIKQKPSPLGSKNPTSVTTQSSSAPETGTINLQKGNIVTIEPAELPTQKPQLVRTIERIPTPNITLAKPSAAEEADVLLQAALAKKSTQTIVVSQAVDPQKLLKETEWDLALEKRKSLRKSINGGLKFLKAEAFARIEHKNDK